MKEYNYLQAIYMSFYSGNLYRDVARNWGGGVLLYLFILLAICWGIMFVKYQPLIEASFTQGVNKIAPQVPQVTIKNGEISTPENKPYKITDPDSNSVIAVIDTSGQYKNLSEVPDGAQYLITKNTIIYSSDSDTTKTQSIPASLNMDIKPDQIKDSLIKFVDWSWVIFFPLLLLFSFIYRIFQALVYAFFGKIYALMAGSTLGYFDIFKLSMVAITPVIILGTILDFIGVMFHFQWLLYFIISMAYLIFAIKANK